MVILKRLFPKSDRGIYLVLVVFLVLLVFMAFFALVLGLGLGMTDKSRLQNIANTTSMASLKSFIEAPEPYSNREAKAVEKANELIDENQDLPGVELDLPDLVADPGSGEIPSGAGGIVTLGMWYVEALGRPAPCSKGSDPNDPCDGKYPCFVPNNCGASVDTANSVRLSLRTDSFRAPFGNFLGNEIFSLGSKATAAIVQRCTVYLLDTSGSSVQETHNAPPILELDDPNDPDDVCPSYYANTCSRTPLEPGNPYWEIRDDHSYFSYDTDAVPPASTCDQDGDEVGYYCNLAADREVDPGYRAAGADIIPHNRHFQSDFIEYNSFWGPVLVDNYFDSLDGYWGPQPLSRFYLAFNRGLEAVNAVRSPGDKAMMAAFTSDYDPEPPELSGVPRLAEDLGLLIQLTNFFNRGLVDVNQVPIAAYPVRYPNALDRGWFHKPGIDERTNHIKAIVKAVNALSQCPDTSSKAIIMASDGVPTCKFTWTDTDSDGFPDSSDGDPATDCFRGFYDQFETAYLPAESVILNQLKTLLKDRRISFTVLLDSASVGPNFMNISPDISADPPRFYDADEVRDLPDYCGIRTGSDPSCTEFFDNSPKWTDNDAYNNWVTECTTPPSPTMPPGSVCNGDAYAYSNRGRTGVQFRRVNGLWGEVALETGGVVCPLLPLCPDDARASPTYIPNPGGPDVLNPIYRKDVIGNNNPLTCSATRQTKEEQAVACVLGVVGGNPFQNVEEDY